jgi:hypothetical protein
MQALCDNAELLHEPRFLVGLRSDPFELVESGFQPAPHHGHFRADLHVLRLDPASLRIARSGRITSVLVPTTACDIRDF